MSAEEIAQRQLDAYNARDLERFVSCYAEEVRLADLPDGKVFAQGRADLRRIYGALFERAPDLHCRLVHRICVGRFAVDQEEVTGIPGRGLVRAVAIYEVAGESIARGWFLREQDRRP